MILQKEPVIDSSCFVAQDAVIKGNVFIESDTSIWFHAVIRAEETCIRIGKNSNVQDTCVIHVDPWVNVTIGDNVSIGHGAILHGCKISDHCLIGMGAIVMNHAVIGKNCIVGAGCVVTEHSNIPDNSLVIGVPGKVIRSLTQEEIDHIHDNAAHYVKISKEYKALQESRE